MGAGVAYEGALGGAPDDGATAPGDGAAPGAGAGQAAHRPARQRCAPAGVSQKMGALAGYVEYGSACQVR